MRPVAISDFKSNPLFYFQDGKIFDNSKVIYKNNYFALTSEYKLDFSLNVLKQLVKMHANSPVQKI